MQKKKNIKGKISHYGMAAAGEARLEQAGSSEMDLAFLRMLTPTNASRSHAENVLRASVSTPAGLLFYICRMFFWPVAAWGLALRAALMPDCFVRHLPVKANANKRISSRSANAPSCEMMTFSLAGLFLNPPQFFQMTEFVLLPPQLGFQLHQGLKGHISARWRLNASLRQV